MKKALVFTLLCISANLAQAQTCTRTLSTWVAAQGGYPIYGTATMVEQPDSTILLTLDNAFSTTGGPDLHLFLSTTNASPTSPNSVNYLVAPLQSNNGYQTYIIPDSISITQYDYLLIHCVMYNHFWGGGMFGNCISSVADNPEMTELKAYPNPSYGKFFLEDIEAGATISVYDFSGKKVAEDVNADHKANYVLDLTKQPTGMYVLEVTTEKAAYRKKLVIYR